MAASTLTEARRPRRTTYDIRDARLKGFVVRVYPTGCRRYFVHTQNQGPRIWKIIGDVSEISRNDVRERAQSLLAAVRNGTLESSDGTQFETDSRRGGLSPLRAHMEAGNIHCQAGCYCNHNLPWFLGRQIAEITGADVRKWFFCLHATPVAADMSALLLSVILTRAEDYCGLKQAFHAKD